MKTIDYFILLDYQVNTGKSLVNVLLVRATLGETNTLMCKTPLFERCSERKNIYHHHHSYYYHCHDITVLVVIVITIIIIIIIIIITINIKQQTKR